MHAGEFPATSSALRNTSAPAAAAPGISAKRARAAHQPIALLGVAFDNLTLRETVGRVEEMIASPRSHYVVTANMDFLAQARRDVELQHILLNAHLVLCDGTPLVWASRLFGNPLPERVAGADVVPELIRVAAEKNYRVFFLGATEEANTQAITRLRAQFPNLAISHYSPPFRPLQEMDNAEIIRRIRAAKPDLLFVAFGCPKAEKWIARHSSELGVPVAMGVGATIDFLAGRVKRAPLWMQRGGGEWLYRLGQEPQRLCKRYVTDLWFFGGAMARQCWTMKLRCPGSRTQTRTVVIQSNGTWQRVEAAHCLDQNSIERDATQWDKIARADRHCLLELAETKWMDSTGVAALIHLQKKLHLAGRRLILLSPSPAVRQVLKAMRWTQFFEIATDALAARAVLQTRECERDVYIGVDATIQSVWLGELRAIEREHATAEAWTLDLAAVRFRPRREVSFLIRAGEIARTKGIRLRFGDPAPVVRNVLRDAKREYLRDQFA